MIKVNNRSFKSIFELEELVIHAASEYEKQGYVEDFCGLEITDAEYDKLLRELKELNPDSSALHGTSPSKYKASGNIVIHNPPMTSISKADGTQDEKIAIYDKWIDDCCKRLGVHRSKLQLAGSYKHDGVAIRINYVDGKLHTAALRPRDGVNGTDVTHHIRNIKGVPDELPVACTLSLNGEIECRLSDFKKINEERDKLGEDLYKNPRNYTAGCLNRDSGEETLDSGLCIAFYSITGFDDWQKYYRTEVERALWANSSDGLNLVDEHGNGYFVQVRIHKFAHLEMMESHALNLDYYTDGVIIKVNDLQLQEELGHVGDDPVKEPRGSLAWKYKEDTAVATVSYIEWNASRTGRIVPTAIFKEPFLLADTANSRATCNNIGWMQSHGLGPGAKVECKKGGKIIPNIVRVIVPVDSPGAPINCPSCAGLAVIKVNGENSDLTCPYPNCPAKHIKTFVFYLQMLGCKGLGSAAMEKMVNNGTVLSLIDLYNLDEDDIIDCGMTEREALLILTAIHKVKPKKSNDAIRKQIIEARDQKQQYPAWQFFAALGIPGAGKTVGKVLAKKFSSFEKIITATLDELNEVEGIGPTTAESVHRYFQANSSQVLDLLKRHVTLTLPKKGKFTGLNFVLTGDFSLKKSHWESQIIELGGNIQISVGRRTDFLVKELSSGTSKEKKAIDNDVPIINVQTLESMIL